MLRGAVVEVEAEATKGVILMLTRDLSKILSEGPSDSVSESSSFSCSPGRSYVLLGGTTWI